jgi:hypothetical protein
MVVYCTRLHAQVEGSPVLSQYVDHILGAYFSTPVPVLGDAGLAAGRSGSSSGEAPEQGAGGGAASSSTTGGAASGSKWSDAAKVGG